MWLIVVLCKRNFKLKLIKTKFQLVIEDLRGFKNLVGLFCLILIQGQNKTLQDMKRIIYYCIIEIHILIF